MGPINDVSTFKFSKHTICRRKVSFKDQDNDVLNNTKLSNTLTIFSICPYRIYNSILALPNNIAATLPLTYVTFMIQCEDILNNANIVFSHFSAIHD